MQNYFIQVKPFISSLLATRVGLTRQVSLSRRGSDRGRTIDLRRTVDSPTVQAAVKAESSDQLRQVELVLNFGAEALPVAEIKKQCATQRG